MLEAGHRERGNDAQYGTVKLARRLLGEEIYPKGKSYITLFVIFCLTAFINYESTFLIKKVFDEVAREDMSPLVEYGVLLGSFYVVIALLGYIETILTSKLEFRTIASLQEKISTRFAGCARLGSEPVEGYAASQMFFMTESGWQTINTSVNMMLREILRIIAMSVAAYTLFASIAPLCALVILVYGGVSVWYILISRRLIMSKFDGMRQIIDGVVANIRSGEPLQAATDSCAPKIESAIQLYRERSTQLRIVDARLSLIVQSMTGVIAVLILVWGTWLTTKGQSTFGTMVALQAAFVTFALGAQRLAGAGVTLGADFKVVEEMYRFRDGLTPRVVAAPPHYSNAYQF